MIIINGFENITINQYGNIKIYDNGFSKVMLALRNNILKYSNLKSDEKFVVLVLNFNELNRKLKEKSKNNSGEDIFSISDLINLSRNSNNFRFIIYDLSSNSDDLKNGDLIDYFDGLSGIWIGNNFDGQMVFESKNGMDFGTIGDDVLVSIPIVAVEDETGKIFVATNGSDENGNGNRFVINWDINTTTKTIIIFYRYQQID